MVGREPLTKKRVITAALALADREGVSALSMRKLAQTLGVEAMSLYHHVAGKDEILDGLVDAVFTEIGEPRSGDGWLAGMRAHAVAARAALRRHPWATALLDSRTNPGPATLRHHDEMLGLLRRAGFSIPLAAHAVSALDSYVYGFAMQEVALPFESSDEMIGLAETMLVGVAQDYPYLAEMIVHATTTGWDHADEFEYGLDLVLDGLARAHTAER